MSNHVIVDYEVPVTMRDGTVLRAVVFRPEGEGKWPVLITRTPYSKDAVASGSPDDAHLDILSMVRSGYAVVVQDCRGRFTSDGPWDMATSLKQEADDGVDTVAWAASLPYSSGNVGSFGGSYVGFTQWSMLCNDTPALKAAIPSCTFADPHEGFWYRSGAMELGLFVQWVMGIHADTIMKTVQDPAVIGQFFSDMYTLPEQMKILPLRGYAPFERDQVPASALEIIQRGYADRTIAEPLTFAGKHDRAKAPTINVTGWYDVFLKGTLQHFAEMRSSGATEQARDSKLIVGPWTHWGSNERVGNAYFGLNSSAAAAGLTHIQKEWFDHHLKGIENSISTMAPVKLFVMGDNEWRDEQEWPLARTEYTSYYLHMGGALNTELPGAEQPDRYDYDPADPVPTAGGACLVYPQFPEGPQDHRVIESRPDVLTFTTPVLEEDVEVTGPVKVFLWASTNVKDTDFVARLIDVQPDGYAFNLADGIIRGRYRDYAKDGSESLLEPGKPYLFEIDLWATSNVFKKGHCIRLEITSSCFPRWDRNPNSGNAFGTDTEADFVVAEQTILHDAEHPSHIVLPIIPRM